MIQGSETIEVKDLVKFFVTRSTKTKCNSGDKIDLYEDPTLLKKYDHPETMVLESKVMKIYTQNVLPETSVFLGMKSRGNVQAYVVFKVQVEASEEADDKNQNA